MIEKPLVKKMSVKTSKLEKLRHSPLSLELKHTLSQGDLGGQVKMAQDALILLGFDEFKNDGRFGTMMGKSVRRFQESRGLRITGEINPLTWETIFTPIKVEENKSQIKEK